MIFLFLQCVSTVLIVFIIISPLNSYLYIHWILDFKSILLLYIELVYIGLTTYSLSSGGTFSMLPYFWNLHKDTIDVDY